MSDADAQDGIAVARRTFVDGDGTTVAVPTYHGRPVIKEPAWTWEVPWYLFAGGMAGASSVVAFGARLSGNEVLAGRARSLAAAGAAVSPPLLIADLGRPARFLNMLRVFKPTSVMSVGSWVLASYSALASGSLLLHRWGRLPRLQPIVDGTSAGFGAAMTVYTGALVADTSVPVWHDARRWLPPLFASSGLAAAGAAASLITPPAHAGPARRAAVVGAGLEVAVDAAMRRDLGPIGTVYEREAAGRFHRVARIATSVGATLVAAGGARRRTLSAAGAALVLVGSVCTRWSVYRAGFQSARDPVATLGPQRARLVRGEGTHARP